MTENFTQQISFELLKTLIINHTMSTFREGGTFYGQRLTYEERSNGYQYHSPILPKYVRGKNGRLIMSRISKTGSIQQERCHPIAEYSPLDNVMCDLIKSMKDVARVGYEAAYV